MHLKLPLAILLLALTPFGAYADVVRIPVGQQQTPTDVSLPQTGTTKESVSREYGEPLRRQGPTGEPPIYRWDYDEFTVYFENDRVIHSVVKFVPKIKEENSQE